MGIPITHYFKFNVALTTNNKILTIKPISMDCETYSKISSNHVPKLLAYYSINLESLGVEFNHQYEKRYDSDLDENAALCVIEYIQGDNIEDSLMQSKNSYSNIVHVMRQLIQGVQDIHRSGYAHADLYYYDNIIITSELKVYVIDIEGQILTDNYRISDYHAIANLIQDMIIPFPTYKVLSTYRRVRRYRGT